MIINGDNIGKPYGRRKVQKAKINLDLNTMNILEYLQQFYDNIEY